MSKDLSVMYYSFLRSIWGRNERGTWRCFFLGIPGVFSEKKGLLGIIPSTYYSCSRSAILKICPTRKPTFFFLTAEHNQEPHTDGSTVAPSHTSIVHSFFFLLLGSSRLCLGVPARRNTARLPPQPLLFLIRIQ
jgi:hypothetical protein